MAIIPCNTTVTSTLALGSNAAGAATLMIKHSPDDGSEGPGDSTGVAPGTSGSVSITPTKTGTLGVNVTMASPADKGTLTVSPGGPTNQQIQGDTNVLHDVLC